MISFIIPKGLAAAVLAEVLDVRHAVLVGRQRRQQLLELGLERLETMLSEA